MPSSVVPDPSPVLVRLAIPQDLGALRELEEAADRSFEPLFGPAPFGTERAPTGQERAAEPGFLLVAVAAAGTDGTTDTDDTDDTVGSVGSVGAMGSLGTEGTDDVGVVGFAHVLERDGQAHLEQLAVDPEHQGAGIGTPLIEAACAEAAARGHRRITLRTYATVPFNAPLYARRGFAVVPDPGTPFHRELARAEEAHDLGRLGQRVTMVREL